MCTFSKSSNDNLWQNKENERESVSCNKMLIWLCKRKKIYLFLSESLMKIK